MIVIADTVPLIQLILIEGDTFLKGLYARIMIPQAVAAELQAPGVPAKVKAWISNPPDWLEINKTVFRDDPSLAQLDAGQRDAILLAQSLKADVRELSAELRRSTVRSGVESGFQTLGGLG